MNTALPIDRTSGQAIQVQSPVTRDSSDTSLQYAGTITSTAQETTIDVGGVYRVTFSVPTRIEIRRNGASPTAATATTGMRIFGSVPEPLYFPTNSVISIIRDTSASGDGTWEATPS